MVNTPCIHCRFADSPSVGETGGQLHDNPGAIQGMRYFLSVSMNMVK